MVHQPVQRRGPHALALGSGMIARMRNPPVLFLDFDGVLHAGSGHSGGMFTHAPALQEALGEHEVRIVVSSSWRFHKPLSEIRQWLPAALASRVVGATGEAHIGRWARFHEIRAWLDHRAPAADWRALDDATFEFPNPCPQLIACHPQEGFGPRQADALRGWLESLG